MNVEFTEHARKRLEERKIPEFKVAKTIDEPDEVLFDSDKGNLVAVKRFDETYLIVVYTPTQPLKVITVIPTSKLNIVENRIRKGRWVRL